MDGKRKTIDIKMKQMEIYSIEIKEKGRGGGGLP